MRIFILLLVTIAVFIGCALIGFQIAKTVGGPETAFSTSNEFSSSDSEQYNFILVRVDNLQSAQPKLISVWFVSIFFIEENPSTLTLAQIYPPGTPSPKSLSLERAFLLNGEGEPDNGFWDSVKKYNIKWDGYLLFDSEGANLFLQWLVGPNDFSQALEEAAKSSDKSRIMAEQTCRSIADSATRPISEFNWSHVVPTHFRTDLRLESGLSLWDRMTNTGFPVYCEFLPAP